MEKNILTELHAFACRKMPIRSQAGFSIRTRYVEFLDALALVLAAANNEWEYFDEMADHPDCSDDKAVRAKADAIGNAIAILETAINPAHHEQA